MTAPLPADFVRKTYRYLRLGLIGSAFMLAVSILWEFREVGYECLQTSVSGYYFTPVRAVFVSVLVAVGAALIVIKGQGVEDFFLNVAGMLAPVVAFVPTVNAADCSSIDLDPFPLVRTPSGTMLSDATLANVSNNLGALVITGVAGVIVAFVLSRRDSGVRPPLLGLAATLAIILVVGGLYASGWEWYRSQLHNIAAILMFVFLGAASIANARRMGAAGSRRYARLYWLIPILMAVTVGVILSIDRLMDGWAHAIFTLEAVEVSLFAFYWIVQTAEHWNERVATT